jgi:hypothetical protein
MFSKKDQDKKNQQKFNEDSQAFLNDYKELVKKHRRDFDAVLDFTGSAIVARLIVREYTPPSGLVVPDTKLITR